MNTSPRSSLQTFPDPRKTGAERIGTCVGRRARGPNAGVYGRTLGMLRPIALNEPYDALPNTGRERFAVRTSISKISASGATAADAAQQLELLSELAAAATPREVAAVIVRLAQAQAACKSAM